MKIQNILVISGYSGAGKTYLIKFLETIGYYCIDNVHLAVAQDIVSLYSEKVSGVSKLAISIDSRSSNDFSLTDSFLSYLKQQDIKYKILFLVAQDDVLVSRFQQTRMRHPLSFKEKYRQLGLLELINLEKTMLARMRDNADLIIDTTRTTVHDLKEKVIKILNESSFDFWLRMISFGFSKGIPQDTDLVYDLRFLPNPFFVDSLSTLSGKNEEVRTYVMSDNLAVEYFNSIKHDIELILPQYKLMKNYISVAFGCTGGRHRSVSFAILMAEHFKNLGYKVSVEHRDLEDAI